MGKIISLLFFISITVMVDGPNLMKQKKIADFVMFGLFLSIAALLHILYGLGIEVPTPLRAVQFLFEPLYRYFSTYTGITF